MSAKKAIHKNWKTWTAVALMLAAIVAYVLSLDDEFPPAPGAPSTQSTGQ